jgi:hypothetical protein
MGYQGLAKSSEALNHKQRLGNIDLSQLFQILR